MQCDRNQKANYDNSHMDTILTASMGYSIISSTLGRQSLRPGCEAISEKMAGNIQQLSRTQRVEL